MPTPAYDQSAAYDEALPYDLAKAPYRYRVPRGFAGAIAFDGPSSSTTPVEYDESGAYDEALPYDLIEAPFRYTPPRGFAAAIVFTEPGEGVFARDDAYTIQAGVTFNQPVPGVLFNDNDSAAAAITAHLSIGPTHGTLSLNADGSFSYAPADGFTGPDFWTYYAQNPDGTQSDDATVTITVTQRAVQRYTYTGAGLPWQTQPAMLRSISTPFARGSQARHYAGLPWQHAPAQGRSVGLPWLRSRRVQDSTGMPWQHADKLLGRSASLPTTQPPGHRGEVGMPWGVPPSLRHSVSIRFDHPPMHHRATAMPWTVPPNVARNAGIRFDHPPLQNRRWWLPWGLAPGIQWHPRHRVTPIPPIYPAPKYRAPRGFAVAINFACLQPHFRGFAAPIPMGPAACYFAWPKPRTYIMLNTASVKTTLTGHDIAASSIDISESVDDMHHAFRIALADPADLAWLQSAEGEDPIAIEININGWLRTGIVENWQTDQEFPTKVVSVAGRALSALLDADYAPARAYVETADRTSQQLVDRELLYTGYTADYGTVVWNVPAGAWNYTSQSPAQAIRTIAAAAGAIARSHPYDKTIEILPRYPSSPWDYATTAPDKTVLDDYVPHLTHRSATSGAASYDVQLPLWPGSATDKPGLIRPGQLLQFAAASGWKALVTATSISAAMQQSGNGARALVVMQTITLEASPGEPRQNYVLVSGQQVGVSAPVIRTGTAGDKRLPQIVDALITDATVQRERGRNAIAAGASAATSNLWLGLRDLLPSQTVVKGNITAANSDGSYTIATTDGATIRARPTAGQTWNIPDGVMVQRGYIIDTAPSLPGTTQYV